MPLSKLPWWGCQTLQARHSLRSVIEASDMCTWGYRRVPIKCEWSIRTRTAGTHSKLLHVQLYRHLSPFDVSMKANSYGIALEYTCSCHVQVHGSNLDGEDLDEKYTSANLARTICSIWTKKVHCSVLHYADAKLRTQLNPASALTICKSRRSSRRSNLDSAGPRAHVSRYRRSRACCSGVPAGRPRLHKAPMAKVSKGCT